MENFKNVVYAVVPGWVGLYIDDVLVAQGSSLELSEYLNNKLVYFSLRSGNPRDAEVVAQFHGFPEMLSELSTFGTV